MAGMDDTPTRRQLLGRGAAVAGAALLPWAPASALAQSAQPASARLPVLRPPRLKPGDTIGLFSPSSATYERAPFERAGELLAALGFQAREAPNARARRGQHAGSAAQRADDINGLMADPSVHGLLAITGGSGANRVLPLLDYAAMRRQPKVIAGFSDVTALLNAVTAQCGLVSFHAPVAVSEWNPFSVAEFRAVLIDAEARLLRNPVEKTDNLVPKEHRISTLRPGIARGPLVGGNLAVLSSLAGSPYLPSFDGAILFLEEINEYIYRVDRMLSTLKLMGAFDRLAGVVIGAFTNCGPGDGNYGTLTLDEVFDDWFGPLGVPVYRGAAIGHIRQKFTVPLGLPVEMDADAGTIRLLTPAVR
jgi:muramoyltetrapeptide carboxypeptidase